MPLAKKTQPKERTFTITVEDQDIPLIVTKRAMDEFEVQGLAVMDDILIRLSERHTPSNAPERRPLPLDLIGQMILDGLSSGNMRKIMMCALWVGHHYPSLDGVISDGRAFHFTQTGGKRWDYATLG